MKSHLLPVIIGVALLAASCAISRDADLADSGSDAPAGAETDGESELTQGDGTEEEGDSAPTTTAPPVETTPPTTAPADEVAATVSYADGASFELLHGPLNDIVVPSRENQEFVDLIYQGSIPPGFEAVVLSQTILGEAIAVELEAESAAVSDEDRQEAEDILAQQLSAVLAAEADPEATADRLYADVPYLSFIVELQAGQIALSNHFSANAPDGEGNPCVRHILVDTEAEGDEIQTELAAGADFGELAVERSTGPSGPSGGDLGCAPSASYVGPFAEAVDGATIGEFVGPIETEFGWHVLVVDAYEVDGDQIAQARISDSLGTATVDVDERLGVWDPARLAVLPAG